MSLSHCIHQTLNSKASTRLHSGGLLHSSTLILNIFLFGVIILIANILKRAFSSQLAAKLRNRDRKSGSAGMPRPTSYAVFCLKKKTYLARPATSPLSHLAIAFHLIPSVSFASLFAS